MTLSTYEPGHGTAAQSPSPAEVGPLPGSRSADVALDTLAPTMRGLGYEAAAVLPEPADEMAQRGIDAVQITSRQWRDQALSACDRTSAYVKAQPVKAMLMAAASGAALMGLLGLLSRPRHRG
jgi:ElaB/YqjD/DUF883 family membrane-anchored ribosome-binding protein